MFGRYSIGKFFRDGPTPFGTGGGPELVSLGGVSDVKNQSLALSASTTRSRPTLLADFRFGWFQYNVNVLPFDFGTTPATDAGIPGLNLDNDVHLRPAGVLHRRRPRASTSGRASA